MHNDEILIIGILNIRACCGLSLLTFPTDFALQRVSFVVHFASEALDLLDCVRALSLGMHMTMLNISELWHFE